MLNLELDFTGKVAIVTGAASGMGLLSAQNLAAGGAKVVLVDVNDEALQPAVAGIRTQGGEATGQVVDVRDYSGLRLRQGLRWSTTDALTFLSTAPGAMPGAFSAQREIQGHAARGARLGHGRQFQGANLFLPGGAQSDV